VPLFGGKREEDMKDRRSEGHLGFSVNHV